MRSIGAHEVGEPTRFLPVLTREPNRDAVGVLVEADQLDPALDPAAEPTEPFGQQVFRDVLRERDEPEGHVRRHGHVQPGHLGAVDEHELAPHRDCPIQHVPQQPETLPLPQLEGPRLDTDRLGVRRGLRQSVDDAALHTATPQLDGDRQPDRPRTDDEHRHVCTAVAGECSSGR